MSVLYRAASPSDHPQLISLWEKVFEEPREAVELFFERNSTDLTYFVIGISREFTEFPQIFPFIITAARFFEKPPSCFTISFNVKPSFTFKKHEAGRLAPVKLICLESTGSSKTTAL